MARREMIVPDDRVIKLIRERTNEGWTVNRCRPYDDEFFEIVFSKAAVHRNRADKLDLIEGTS